MAKLLAIIILSSLIMVVSSCYSADSHRTRQFAPQQGDLLFQNSDCGQLCDAIEAVTSDHQKANISHVGIAAKDQIGNPVVIEAVSNGVQSTPLKDFLDRSLDESGNPKVIVGRLKPQYQHLVGSALNNAAKLKGQPYDKVFAIDNGAYYCSELIYEIF
ncbi:MAG: hypothetical protein JRI92_04395, partial [Deltaproteobacteria bacterium]|nr:hypothetical protein [Deltaproteobacteria bacterium]